MLLLTLVESKNQSEKENFQDGKIDIKNFLDNKMQELKRDIKTEVAELKKEMITTRDNVSKMTLPKRMNSIREED